MGLKLITPPATYPVSLAEAKAHLRVDVSDDDSIIEIYRKAATGNAEKFTGRVFIDQTWELTLDKFPSNELKIPLPPLIEIVSVKYDDADGVEQTFSEGHYTVDSISEPGWIVPDSGTWPATIDAINAVRVRFRAGYLDQDQSPEAENVPFEIKAAILLTIGTLYANRETIVIGQTATLLPWAAEQLLRPYRMHVGFA